jgi:uncharacterized protein YndB with AHSA1/START domain
MNQQHLWSTCGMTIEFTVSAISPASLRAIYESWLDSDGHTKMNGSPAHATAGIGDTFDAWDGYISGKNLELDPGKRIVQSWRGARYQETDEDSKIEVIFRAIDSGTNITLTHTNVPDDQASHEPGWITHYFDPMEKYFGESSSQ